MYPKLFFLNRMKKHAKKLSTEVVHDNKWWAYKKDVVEQPDGTTADYFYGETRGGAAMIIPLLADGRVVLIREYRYLRDQMSVGFPRGGLENDESPSEGAKRELLEEAGTEAHELISIGQFESCLGIVKDTVHLFIATGLELGEHQPDSTEDIEIMYRRVDEFDDMVKRGEIWDGQTLAAWAIARDRILAEAA